MDLHIARCTHPARAASNRRASSGTRDAAAAAARTVALARLDARPVRQYAAGVRLRSVDRRNRVRRHDLPNAGPPRRDRPDPTSTPGIHVTGALADNLARHAMRRTQPSIPMPTTPGTWLVRRDGRQHLQRAAGHDNDEYRHRRHARDRRGRVRDAQAHAVQPARAGHQCAPGDELGRLRHRREPADIHARQRRADHRRGAARVLRVGIGAARCGRCATRCGRGAS